MVETLTSLLEPVLTIEGLELVLAEFKNEPGGRVLRLYVDRPGGVTVADCTAVTRYAGDLLYVHLTDAGKFRLEVTSPGADRPLTKIEHFSRFTGCRAVVRINEPLSGRKKFTGVIQGAGEDAVTLMVDGQQVDIPREAVASARLAPLYGEDPC
ncbi:MAG: ribosome maturation factor RimP [Proteobacteria bacterium]|nr:ribosome maturation factor RimP [Pseudomonadota bacterium]